MIPARDGPLVGVRVLELGGVGPIPYCGMYLADLGAEVIRIERPLGDDALSRNRRTLNLFARGKQTIAMDFRGDAGRQVALDLVEQSDLVLEGFRPGVLERLGLGPEDCFARHPALVYGRMSGWGSGGPLSNVAAHDINYLGISGLLSAIGSRDRPVPPLNIVGDFGGALFLVTGLLAALTQARQSGKGQVVDASILGGSMALMAQLYALHDHGDWVAEREANWLDGGAPFYRVYETADRGFMAVGAIEPQFYAALLKLLDLEGEIDRRQQMERASWQATADRFAAVFRTRSREEWTSAGALVEACCTPVLNLGEARAHPQMVQAGLLVDVGGKLEPAPQPLFSRTPPSPPVKASDPGADAESVLRGIGRDAAAIAALYDAGVVSRPSDDGRSLASSIGGAD